LLAQVAIVRFEVSSKLVPHLRGLCDTGLFSEQSAVRLQLRNTKHK
jgi:hypothetical protein